MADVNLLTQLDIQSGGDGTPSVVTPGQSWRFKGFTPEAGGNPGDGTFYVDGVEGTYSIGDTVGTDDSPVINIDGSAKGLYEFEYYIPECDFGTSIFLSNTSCTVCLAGDDSSMSVCNSCDVDIDLFDEIPGTPASGGTWVQISGTDTLTITNGSTGTVNFNGVTDDTYVLEYQISASCKSTMTITVAAAPDPGTNKTITLCDSGGLRNLQTDVGGDPGDWTVDILPPAGDFDPDNGTFDPAPGDADDWFIPTVYVFTKSVSVQGTDSMCEGECMATSTVTANVYKLWRPGVDSLYNSICNDGVQTVDVADFMNDFDPGGYWQFVGFIRASDSAFISEIDMYIDGVLTTLDLFGDYPNVEIIEQDSFTLRVPSGTPPGELRFWRKADHKNGTTSPLAPCRSVGEIGFNIIDCGGTTCTSNPQITLTETTGGTCVHATLSGSYSNVASTTWTYRTSQNGSFQSYTPGNDICGYSYVEFRMNMTFSDGCPSVERTAIWTYNQTCSNSPTVSASCGSCSITLTGGGTINSPINSDIIQWRNAGNSTWNVYTGPINFSTASKSIEYRRQVSFSDGCTSITTSVGSITCNCTISSCAVSISANGSTLTASVSNCNQSISYQWEYSANGTSGWINLGTSQSQAANQGSGYYRVTVDCGTGQCTSTYQYTEGTTCQNNVTVSYSGGVLTANVTGCGANPITYVWQYSASGTGWTSATGATNSSTLTPQNGGGYYRVLVWCPSGQCPVSATYHLMATCNNSPTVTATVDNNNCYIVLNRTGTNNSPVDLDQIYWRPQGSTTWQGYSTGYHIPFSGYYEIEFYRAVSYTDGCPTIVDSDTATGDCNAGTCSVSIQFNGSILVASGGCTGTWQWAYSSNGSTGWVNLGTSSSQTPTMGNGYYRATLLCSGGSSCSDIYHVIQCSNTPDVTVNTSNCSFSFTKTGTNNSPVSSDVVQYKLSSSGTWINYTSGSISVPYSSATYDYRRVVTYSDGCTTVTAQHSFSVTCTSACNVTVTIINGTTLQANVSGCGGSSVSYQWAYSTNGTSGWSNLGTGSTQSISNGTGYYRVTVNCSVCSAQDIYHFIDCNAFTVSASYSCSTGVSYSLSGGTAPYTYSISPGTMLSNGSHSWTITDANGCQRSGSLNVSCCPTGVAISLSSWILTFLSYNQVQIDANISGVGLSMNTGSFIAYVDKPDYLNTPTLTASINPTMANLGNGNYRFTFTIPSSVYWGPSNRVLRGTCGFNIKIKDSCGATATIVSGFGYNSSVFGGMSAGSCAGYMRISAWYSGQIPQCQLSSQTGIVLNQSGNVIVYTNGNNANGATFDMTGTGLTAGTVVFGVLRCPQWPSGLYITLGDAEIAKATC